MLLSISISAPCSFVTALFLLISLTPSRGYYVALYATPSQGSYSLLPPAFLKPFTAIRAPFPPSFARNPLEELWWGGLEIRTVDSGTALQSIEYWRPSGFQFTGEPNSLLHPVDFIYFFMSAENVFEMSAALTGNLLAHASLETVLHLALGSSIYPDPSFDYIQSQDTCHASPSSSSYYHLCINVTELSHLGHLGPNFSPSDFDHLSSEYVPYRVWFESPDCAGDPVSFVPLSYRVLRSDAMWGDEFVEQFVAKCFLKSDPANPAALSDPRPSEKTDSEETAFIQQSFFGHEYLTPDDPSTTFEMVSGFSPQDFTSFDTECWSGGSSDNKPILYRPLRICAVGISYVSLEEGFWFYYQSETNGNYVGLFYESVELCREGASESTREIWIQGADRCHFSVELNLLVSTLGGPINAPKNHRVGDSVMRWTTHESCNREEGITDPSYLSSFLEESAISVIIPESSNALKCWKTYGYQAIFNPSLNVEETVAASEVSFGCARSPSTEDFQLGTEPAFSIFGVDKDHVGSNRLCERTISSIDLNELTTFQQFSTLETQSQCWELQDNPVSGSITMQFSCVENWRCGEMSSNDPRVCITPTIQEGIEVDVTDYQNCYETGCTCTAKATLDPATTQCLLTPDVSLATKNSVEDYAPFIVAGVVVPVIMLIISVVVGTWLFISRKRLQKEKHFIEMAEELEFDVLIQQQQANSENVAKIRINSDLYEIDPSELDIGKVLGSGGSGTIVYKTIWRGTEAAYKSFRIASLLTDDESDGSETLKEFEKELKLMTSLKHPSLLHFYGACLKPPSVGILMEFCSNGDLRHFYQSVGGDVRLQYRLRFLLEIARGMAFLHTVHLIHRDLKCLNVLLTENLECKIMDFGIYHGFVVLSNTNMITTTTGLARVTSMSNRSMTKAIGTGTYMAPEMTLGLAYDEKIDVFAFGIMGYELLSGDFHPYGSDVEFVQLRVAMTPSLRPPIKAVDCFPWLRTLVSSCWRHDPNRRPSFLQIIETLEAGDLSVVIYLSQWHGSAQSCDEPRDVCLHEMTMGALHDAASSLLGQDFRDSRHLTFFYCTESGDRGRVIRTDDDVAGLKDDCVVYFVVTQSENLWESAVKPSLQGRVLQEQEEQESSLVSSEELNEAYDRLLQLKRELMSKKVGRMQSRETSNIEVREIVYEQRLGSEERWVNLSRRDRVLAGWEAVRSYLRSKRLLQENQEDADGEVGDL